MSVRTDTAEGIATLTLADVDNRNALSGAVIDGLLEGLEVANRDPSVRAVVVTNEGGVFCAGANLKEQSTPRRSRSRRRSAGYDEVLHAIQTSPTPVIGRICGHVVGGGVGLAASMDISIASQDVEFGFTEVRLGVVPAIISVVCLPKMRRGDALEAFLRGNRWSAQRAVELGLINRAVPAAELDAAVREVLDDVLLGGPEALAAAKRLVYEVPTMDTAEAFEWTARLSATKFASDEAREGMAAFLGRRPPDWAPRREERG